MSGSVDVQSSARRSYKAVVMPTDALLTLGMLKLTSLIVMMFRTNAVYEGGELFRYHFRVFSNAGINRVTTGAKAA